MEKFSIYGEWQTKNSHSQLMGANRNWEPSKMESAGQNTLGHQRKKKSTVALKNGEGLNFFGWYFQLKTVY